MSALDGQVCFRIAEPEHADWPSWVSCASRAKSVHTSATTRSLASASPRLVATTVWFARLYEALGFVGASSHSGRRTFITKAARKIVEAGGSLRDVQELAGHSSLATTQRYIAGDAEAKRRVVALV
jgi:integrase/recombinase XerD